MDHATPRRTADVREICRIGEHAACPGLYEIRVRGEHVPAVTGDCGCTCHAGQVPTVTELVAR